MTCQTCGLASPSFSEFCTHCGARQILQAAALAGVSQPGSSYRSAPEIRVTLAVDQTVYPEFLMRFFAFLIDSAIVGILVLVTYAIMVFLIGTVALGGMQAARGMRPSAGMGVAALGAGAFFFVLDFILILAVYIGYFVMQETSSRQATIGKSLLGMKVSTVDGKPISVLQSLARLLIKDTFSFVLMIGYFMAAFTERKQALHDYVAGTLVVKA
jgi:uncharacterized RDD family membrane protein YckC